MSRLQKASEAAGTLAQLGCAFVRAGFSMRALNEALKLEEQKLLLQMVLGEDQREPGLALLASLMALGFSELAATHWVKALAMRGLIEETIAQAPFRNVDDAELKMSILVNGWETRVWDAD